MKRSYILAAGAGLLLVSASPPELDSVVAADSGSYPTCTASVTDRCVQREGSNSPPRAVAAPAEAPREVASHYRTYPPCTATRTDSCTQIRGTAVRSAARGGGHRKARRQLAYLRAGERG